MVLVLVLILVVVIDCYVVLVGVGNSHRFRNCKQKSAYDFTRTLVSHGMQLTHNSRSFMDEHPNEPEPSDYTKYPGKMDHITAVSLRVGCVMTIRDMRTQQHVT